MRIRRTSSRLAWAAFAVVLALALAGLPFGSARAQDAADEEPPPQTGEQAEEQPEQPADEVVDALDEEFVDGIAAQVGSDIVLASEVYRFSLPVEKKMRAAGAPEDEIAKLRADLLERMIERRLIEQAVRRVEIDASDGEIDAAIASIADENGLTGDELRKTVEAKGMTYDAYREQLRGEIQRQKLVSGAVQAQVRVEDEEIRALFAKRFSDQPEGGEEVRLRHILVPYGDDTGVGEIEACGKARLARQRALGGEDFAEVAGEVSAVNANQGGDVGWVHLSNLAAWMAVPVSGMEVGAVSDVIRMPFGCNVLYLVERRVFRPMTYEQARKSLHDELFQQKMAEQYQTFVDTLRERTYIERKGVFAGASPASSESHQP